MLFIPAILVCVAFVTAFAMFAFVGFVPSPDGVSTGHFTASNYAAFFTDPSAVGILLYTILFAGGITVATIVIGYPLAYLMARARSRHTRSMLLGILVLTFLTGSISRAYGWLLLLGRQGMLNSLLLWAGIVDRPLALIYNSTGVFIALLHFTLPYFALTVFGSIRGVSPQVEEAARDLGASAIVTFFKVTIPITLPAVIAGASLAFALAISAFVFPLILGGGRVRLISNFIYDQIFVSFNMPFAAASAAIFLGVSLATLLLFRALNLAVARNLRGRASS